MRRARPAAPRSADETHDRVRAARQRRDRRELGAAVCRVFARVDLDGDGRVQHAAVHARRARRARVPRAAHRVGRRVARARVRRARARRARRAGGARGARRVSRGRRPRARRGVPVCGVVDRHEALEGHAAAPHRAVPDGRRRARARAVRALRRAARDGGAVARSRRARRRQHGDHVRAAVRRDPEAADRDDRGAVVRLSGRRDRRRPVRVRADARMEPGGRRGADPARGGGRESRVADRAGATCRGARLKAAHGCERASGRKAAAGASTKASAGESARERKGAQGSARERALRHSDTRNKVVGKFLMRCSEGARMMRSDVDHVHRILIRYAVRLSGRTVFFCARDGAPGARRARLTRLAAWRCARAPYASRRRRACATRRSRRACGGSLRTSRSLHRFGRHSCTAMAPPRSAWRFPYPSSISRRSRSCRHPRTRRPAHALPHRAWAPCPARRRRASRRAFPSHGSCVAALRDVGDRRARERHELLRRQVEHRVRMARRGPQAVEIEQVAIDQHHGLDEMADRAHAADRVAGVVAHELRVRAADFADLCGDLPFVDAVRAARDDEHRRAVGAAPEQDRFRDLRDRAAEARGGLGRSLAGFLEHHDRLRMPALAQQQRDAASGIGKLVDGGGGSHGCASSPRWVG
ncbi:hypothetical protein BURPS1710b_0540 [Burkholderia pseudomallei 1710b]|uniref:Uncharacterized protein n=1 Tax=Burkholderia pseudomallei (strain 1710b) TaxID=320372 RepID=Q3JWU9_BURP1|nr:hypothetical protein BURPS1710b_0540 [Burkholderia pseudomallei 1710b]